MSWAPDVVVVTVRLRLRDEELTLWEGDFVAVWPDGSTSKESLNGYPLGVDESLPGHHDTVLDRYDVERGRLIGRKPNVVGYFRPR
jgi:hypothetical protein